MDNGHMPGANDDVVASTASVVTVPRRWAKVFWRLLGLEPGRYLLTVTVGGDGEPADLAVLAAGKVEVPK